MDSYFLPKPTMAVDNYSNENTVPPALSRKLIYYVNYVSGIYCLCIPISVVLEVIAIAYNKNHLGFAQYYEFWSYSWYIGGLTKLLQIFICYYSQCLQLQIKKYLFYSSFQPIHSLSILFYIFMLDFVLVLLLSITRFNLLILLTCKFLKQVTLVESKNI